MSFITRCPRLATVLLLGLAAASALGCAPATYVTVPAFRGRVVDAERRPVGGATVHVSADRTGEPIATLTTTPDGRFARREQSRTFLYIAGGDPIQERFTIAATFAGEQSNGAHVSSDLRVWHIGPSVEKDLGDLKLLPR